MSRLYKQPTTKPIPAGATIVNCKGGVKLAKWTDAGGKEYKALLNLAGDRIRVLSRKWYGEWRDADGRLVREALSPDKRAAQLMLNDRVREAEMGKAGVRDPFTEHRKRTLADHLQDYRRELEARGNDPRYVSMTVSRILVLLDGCGFVFAADLSASRVMDWLAGLREKGRTRATLDPAKEWYTPREAAAVLGIKPGSFSTAAKRNRVSGVGNGRARRYSREAITALQDRLCKAPGVETSNQYLSAVKSFCRWLVKDRRTGDNPLAHLEAGNTAVDRRHDRRELTSAELRRLLATADASDRTFRGLTGRDRFVLYAVACGAGVRASGLGSLTPERFDLNPASPTVTVSAKRNKARVPRVQPLPADLAELLREYLAGKPAGKPVWPGTWARDGKGGEMLRLDLEAAGIPYSIEGADGPLFADFHSLRHSYITALRRGGVDLRTAQELAGHSRAELTERYSHVSLHDLNGAVEKLPKFLPERTAPAAEKAG